MAGGLPPLYSKNSMRGWILNAPTCAPVTPRKALGRDGGPGKDVAAILSGGTTSDWGSTARCDFAGMKPDGPTMAYRPSPRSNLIGGDDDLSRFSSSSQSAHAHPGRSPREVRKIYSNAPSEVDHPMFGLHDPQRKARLGNMFPTSLNSDTFMAPTRAAYMCGGDEPPYPDTAQHALSFDKTGRHTSEQQSKFAWPAWSGRPRMIMKPISQLGSIE